MKQLISTLGAIVLFLFITPGNSSAQYSPKEWPEVKLRFSETGTLTDVFDSGLRPYRFPTLEWSLLEAKHARVAVVQHDGRLLPEFPAERIVIKPLQGGLLSSLEMTRYKAAIDESREMMRPYLTNGGRSLRELDDYLAAVKANYVEFDAANSTAGNFTVSWTGGGGVRYAVSFRKAFDPKRPLIMFMVINWSQLRTPSEKRSFYKEPIPPPPGYEDVSMEAPPNYGPDSQIDISASRKNAFVDRYSPSETPTSGSSKSPQPTS